MVESDEQERWVRRVATWLTRLAERATMDEAAGALFEIRMTHPRTQPANGARRAIDSDAAEREIYDRALRRHAPELDRLIPAWIERFLESLQKGHCARMSRLARIPQDRDAAGFNFADILTLGELERTLAATAGAIDAHLSPLVAAIGRFGRDEDEHLAGAIGNAGPGISTATEALMAALRANYIWCWPSKLASALARAARFDSRVLPSLREMMGDADPEVQRSAVDVMGALGALARPAAEDLFPLWKGDENQRCEVVVALGRLGAPSPRALDLIERAMSDESGYVRRAAVRALGSLRVDAERFVPLLVAACDYADYLHDESLPTAAVRALEAYGPTAQAAVPRLRLFLEGSIKDRTVSVDRVLSALARITDSGELIQAVDWVPVLTRSSAVAADEPLFPVTYRERQCYVDREGRLALRTDFENGQGFHEDRAIVFDAEGRTFVIDRGGRVVFESTWETIDPFSEGMAAVRRDDLWGFVDREGSVVVEPRYDSVTRFSEGLAGVEVGRSEINLGGLLTFARPGCRGFIDRSGNVVIPIEYHDLQPFSGGLAAFCKRFTMEANPLLDGREVPTDRKYGFIDRAGHVVIPDVYDGVSSFSEGRASVRTGPLLGQSREGIIDIKGRIVVPARLTSAGKFKDGVAVVRGRGRKRRSVALVIDPNGAIVLETRLRLVDGFSEGLAAAWMDESCGVIDLSGEAVIAPQFDDVQPFTKGLAAVQRGDWHGLINRQGRFVWGPTTEHCCPTRELKSEWS
jgi:hypothetical protein